MPHVYCLRDPGVVALHAISDGLIAASYFAIPITLILIVRRRTDLAFRWAYILFGIFIFACGATYVLAVVTLWCPVYRLEGATKLLTALASAATAVLLVRLVPQALAAPGTDFLRKEVDEQRRAVEIQTLHLRTTKSGEG